MASSGFVKTAPDAPAPSRPPLAKLGTIDLHKARRWRDRLGQLRDAIALQPVAIGRRKRPTRCVAPQSTSGRVRPKRVLQERPAKHDHVDALLPDDVISQFRSADVPGRRRGNVRLAPNTLGKGYE